MPEVTPSEAESRRFARAVGRINGPVAIAIPLAANAVRNGSHDLVIVRGSFGRSDPTSGIIPEALSGARDLSVLECGDVVTYEGPVRAERRERLERLTVWTDADDRLVTGIFADYRNHVAMNPQLDAAVVPEGYAEWAQSHVHGAPGAACFRLTDERGAPMAFAAVTLDGDALVIDLAGVAPAHRRRGIYQRLLDGLERVAAEWSATRIRIATQESNEPVIRAWLRRGWVEASVARVWHVMPREG